jgi:hypothetical protein
MKSLLGFKNMYLINYNDKADFIKNTRQITV